MQTRSPSKDAQRSKLRVLTVFCSVFLLFSGVGCADKTSKLVFRSTESSSEYSQQFKRAFYSYSENGEYNVVLIEDGIVPVQGKSNAPLASSAGAVPLSQIVHIRILWKPLRGSKPDTPSATNAVINWYVRTNNSPAKVDRLHYRGAGFVSVQEAGDTGFFNIRSAHLELAEGVGQLRDPLGSSNVTGAFTAIRNTGMVTSAMNSLRDEPGQPAPGAHEGAPPRLPPAP